MPLVSGTLKTLKTDFDCFEHKERENEVRSLFNFEKREYLFLYS